MQAPSQTFPVLSFLGVIVQLGGALMLIGLSLMLRRFVLRRAYFTAWAWAWASLALAISALVVRYILLPGITHTALEDTHPVVRGLYFVYQLSKCLGFVFFVRGTLMYVGGTTSGMAETRRWWVVAIVFAAISTLAARHGLNEMVIWQTAIAVPALGYCASALLWLPRARRTVGTNAAGVSFALLAALWLTYAAVFGLAIGALGGSPGRFADLLVGFNSYFDLALNVLLGYSMVLVLMQDARRETDATQAERRIAHDRLRRAALYDALTDSLNRRAFSEGVGLEMVRATFGTVVIADIDNLKVANDRHGHIVGDRLIRHCAEVLRACLRTSDKLFRWGGDEFLLLLPSAHATAVLQRLRKALDAAEPVAAADAGDLVSLQVSLGAADYTSSEELTLAIERADRAMYQEKAHRKNDPRLAQFPASLPPAVQV